MRGYAKFGGLGLEAIGIMRSMQNARLRFDETFMAKGENDNLSNQAIFDDLFGNASAPAAAVKPAAAPAAASPAAAAAAKPAAPAAASLVLSAQMKATIERVMTQYIGPMASIICEDHFDSAGNLQALIHLLADEISAPAQAAKFRLEIAQELGVPP